MMTVEIPPGPMVIGMAMGTTAMAFRCGGLVAHFDVLLNGVNFGFGRVVAAVH